MKSIDDYISRAKELKTESPDSPAVGIFQTNVLKFVEMRWPQHLDLITGIIYPRSVLMNEGYESQLEHQEDMDKIASFLEQMKSEQPSDAPDSSTPPRLESLYPDIAKDCSKLFHEGNYPEAVEKGFKIVRDCLRKKTGEETIVKALGKNHIHFGGAADPAVDKDFQEGVKFLLMSIDFFRNEKAHIPTGNIDNPIHALEYLAMSSLAMRHLENIQVVPKPKAT
jgi:uncharacterized protein (TIGR02391 family)